MWFPLLMRQIQLHAMVLRLQAKVGNSNKKRCFSRQLFLLVKKSLPLAFGLRKMETGSYTPKLFKLNSLRAL